MKGSLLIFAFLVLATFASEATFTEFVKGFLVGVNEKNSVDGLKDCIKDGDAIIAKISSALEDIMTVDIDKLKTGIPKLIDGTTSALTMLKACSSSYTQLAKLANELTRADLTKLIRRVQSSSGHYFHLSVDALEALSKGDYVKAGKSVGTMDYMLFLVSESDEVDTMPDFVKGMLAGISEPADVVKLKACIKENDAAMAMVKDTYEYLRTTMPEDIKKGAKLLLDASMLIVPMLRPCYEGFSVLKRLDAQLSNADLIKIVKAISSAPTAYFHLSIDGLEGFAAGKYDEVGKAFGAMHKMIFLKLSALENMMIDFVKGFFIGIGETGDVNKIIECLKGSEEIMDKIMEAIECIMKMDVQNIMKGIMLMMDAIREFYAKIEPCAQGFLQWEKLYWEIINNTPVKVMMRILAHREAIMNDMIDYMKAFSNGQFERAGKDFGQIMFLIYLVKL